MASGFPGSIDNFTDPLGNSPLTSPDHATLHADVNDAVEKIETYMGLVKVIPTAVTGGTLAANGTITIGNAVSPITVTNAFSSLYNNYLVVIDGADSSNNGQFLRLSLTGITAGWNWNAIYMAGGSSTVVGTNDVNASGIPVSLTGDASWNCIFDITNPFSASQKGVWSRFMSAGGTNYMGHFGGTNTSNVSAASFSLAPGLGTITGGTIRVYGYRN